MNIIHKTFISYAMPYILLTTVSIFLFIFSAKWYVAILPMTYGPSCLIWLMIAGGITRIASRLLDVESSVIKHAENNLQKMKDSLGR